MSPNRCYPSLRSIHGAPVPPSLLSVGKRAHFRHPMQKFLRLEFIASSPDAGLLLLRFWLGFTMLWLHGWDKLMNLFAGKTDFPDPIGIGPLPSLVLTVL